MNRPFKRLIKKIKSNKGYTMIEMLTATIIVILISVMISTGVSVGVRVQKESTFVSNSDMLSGILNTAISDMVRYAECNYTDADIDGGTGLVTGNVKFTNSEYAIRQGYFFLDDDGLLAITKNGIDPEYVPDSVDTSAETAEIGYLISRGTYSGLKIKDFVMTYNPTNDVFAGTYTIFSSEGSSLKKDVTFTFHSVKK